MKVNLKDEDKQAHDPLVQLIETAQRSVEVSAHFKFFDEKLAVVLVLQFIFIAFDESLKLFEVVVQGENVFVEQIDVKDAVKMLHV